MVHTQMRREWREKIIDELISTTTSSSSPVSSVVGGIPSSSPRLFGVESLGDSPPRRLSITPGGRRPRGGEVHAIGGANTRRLWHPHPRQLPGSSPEGTLP
jgi:hypothetical protein